MYLPKHFAQLDRTELRRAIAAYPLATIVRSADGGLAADEVPLVHVDAGDESPGLLRGHVARANPLWRDADARDVLAVFRGPQHYVSPSWYASKREHGKVVPTWNYVVVHAHGVLRAIDEREWLRAFVTGLTDRHEAGRADPWKVSDAPGDYIDTMLGAIVGIEIEVRRLEGKWKLGQNRSEADRAGVVRGLDAERAGTAPPSAPVVLPAR